MNQIGDGKWLELLEGKVKYVEKICLLFWLFMQQSILYLQSINKIIYKKTDLMLN